MRAADAARQRRQIAAAQAAAISRGGRNARAIQRYEAIPFVAMEVDAAGLRELAGQPGVRSIEENATRQMLLADSATLLGVPLAASAGYTGTGWTVAVVDTGVQSTHPFLTGKVVSEACYSTQDPTVGFYSLCPGSVTASVLPGSGRECSLPGCDHGTHVAGIIAGNGGPTNGVAFGASLIAIQVGTYDAWTGSVVFADSDILLGLERVYALRTAHNIAAVNMSLGSGAYTSACDAIQPSYKAMFDTLRSVGIAPVVASGNGGYSDALTAPACVSAAISVGATTKDDHVAPFSNSASFLKLLAPGVSITSAIPESMFGVRSGTSMASPHVAGAWAVLKQRYPAGSVSDILAVLEQTGLGVYDPANGLTKPRIRVGHAFASICQPTVTPSSLIHGAGQTVGAVRVVVGSGCGWRAISGVPWLAITAGGSATGASRVDLAFAANPEATPRTGTLTVGGEVVMVTQLGTDTALRDSSLLWQHEITGSLVAWFLKGTTVTSTAVIGQISDARWRFVGSGDFNGDRKRDLLWQHENGTVVAWLMHGTAHMQSVTLGTVSDVEWKVVGADDFTNDGKDDLVWHHQSSGAIVIWEMNNTQYVGSAFVGEVSELNWRPAGIADLDRDGDPDFVWHHPQSGLVVVWFMNRTTYSRSVRVGSVGDVNWRVVGAADFDGDGYGDILWQHRATRTAVAWLMKNGPAYRASAMLGGVSDLNWSVVAPK
jgi:subtilisin family serine protease